MAAILKNLHIEFIPKAEFGLEVYFGISFNGLMIKSTFIVSFLALPLIKIFLTKIREISILVNVTLIT